MVHDYFAAYPVYVYNMYYYYYYYYYFDPQRIDFGPETDAQRSESACVWVWVRVRAMVRV